MFEVGQEFFLDTDPFFFALLLALCNVRHPKQYPSYALQMFSSLMKYQLLLIYVYTNKNIYVFHLIWKL